MYAKLKFDPSVDFTKIARDIVRCIVNSNGSGGSTLGALEFVDAANSVIEDTVASNWSLASGQTLGTGSSNVDLDKLMYLQQTHGNGTTKTIAIGTNYKDGTGVFTKANNATYSGVCMWPVSDYGESYECIWGRPSDAASASEATSNWFRFTGEEVHIIARDKVLFISGTRSNNEIGISYNLIAEVDTYENREGRTRPAQVWFIGGSGLENQYSNDNPTAITDLRLITGDGPFTGNHTQSVFPMFIDALYNYSSGSEFRIVGLTHNMRVDAILSSPATANATSIFYGFYVERDTAQADGNSTFRNSSELGYESTKLWIGGETDAWGYGPQVGWVPNSIGNVLEEGIFPKDLSGNNIVLMRPVMPVVGDTKYQFDLSSEIGFYGATSNFSGAMSVINDGTDDFVCIKMQAYNHRTTAVAMKK